MTKKTLLFAALFLMMGFAMQAQRIAIVDVNDILTNLPEYAKAQDEIDVVAKAWQQEIAQEYDKIKSMYNEYQAEQVLMSNDMKTQKEDEIMNKEKEVREIQKRKFGPEGELFQKRQELVQPIQDKVFDAIKQYSDERGFDIVLDKSSNTGILFTSDKFDKTNDIKKRLEIK
jgi:outer membrane protein